MATQRVDHAQETVALVVYAGEPDRVESMEVLDVS